MTNQLEKWQMEIVSLSTDGITSTDVPGYLVTEGYRRNSVVILVTCRH